MSLIYLDHSATTLPNPETLTYYQACLHKFSGNPASLHRLGQQAAQAILDSQKTIARAIDCRPQDIVLTSGGSESINWALKGYVAANPKRGQKIITAAGEHAATRESLAALQKQGYTIVTLPVNSQGQPDLAALEQALDQDTVLLTFLLVNNETGAQLPVEQIIALRNRLRPLAAIHLDGVQAFGKIPVSFTQLGVELLSGSGHKFGTPKGIGFLVKKANVQLEPLIHGGGQQNGQRAGTENAPLVAVLAHCLQSASDNLPDKISWTRRLREHLLAELRQHGVEYAMLSPPDGVPQITCLAFPGLRGETLLHALEQSQIYVSTGSACSSKHKGPSATLLAMGYRRQVVECSIRISLNHTNSLSEVTQTAQAIAVACQKYQRRPIHDQPPSR